MVEKWGVRGEQPETTASPAQPAPKKRSAAPLRIKISSDMR